MREEVPAADFLAAAKECDYDAGYGIEHINLGMIIMLRDGSWLERQSYDGREWFVHRSLPMRPNQCVADAMKAIRNQDDIAFDDFE